jgi:hypothetical protein
MADWRAEGERRHEDTLEAVRATAREQVPFNVQVVSACELCILFSKCSYEIVCSILMNLAKHSRLRSGCSLEKLASFVKNVVTSNSESCLYASFMCLNIYVFQ